MNEVVEGRQAIVRRIEIAPAEQDLWFLAHAELGEIVSGQKPGRENDDETILFWHRGLSLSDIALGGAMLEKAKKMGIGQQLFYAHFEPGGNH